jgi:hypothetical protein
MKYNSRHKTFDFIDRQINPDRCNCLDPNGDGYDKKEKDGRLYQFCINCRKKIYEVKD